MLSAQQAQSEAAKVAHWMIAWSNSVEEDFVCADQAAKLIHCVGVLAAVECIPVMNLTLWI